MAKMLYAATSHFCTVHINPKQQNEKSQPLKDKITPEYREAHNEIKRISYRLKKLDGEEREKLLKEYRVKRRRLMSIPCTAQTDKREFAILREKALQDIFSVLYNAEYKVKATERTKMKRR